ncbi:MAG: head GIN domain-containing protein [Pseudomonadota bacterium]|jgi:hypothetical protein
MNHLALAAAFLAAGLTSPSIAQADERRFEVGRFDAIDLAGSDTVRVVAGDAFSVVATGQPSAVAALAISVRDGTLRVARQAGRPHGRGAVLTVTIPSMRSAMISGSGEMSIGPMSVPAFSGSISGSGTLKLIGLRVRTVRFGISGAGTIVAQGSAETVGIDLSGTGRVDSRELATPAVSIDMSGAGSIFAAASQSATVRAGGSGRISVTGGARCEVRNGGGAVVRCA